MSTYSQIPSASLSHRGFSPSPRCTAERPPPSQLVQSQRQLSAPMRCNKCMNPLKGTIFLLKCDCLICEGCADPWLGQNNRCPCCSRPITSDKDLREFLITSQPQKETPKMTENELKKNLYQWVFVKRSPHARELTTIDIYRRLLLQHQKHKETTRFVLKQFLRNTNTLTHRATQMQQGFQNYRQQDTARKQELHKYKGMVDSMDIKLKDLQRQLAERDNIIAQFRRMTSANKAAPRGAHVPSDSSINNNTYHQVGGQSAPPSPSYRVDGRSSYADRSYENFSRPESALDPGMYNAPPPSQHLPPHQSSPHSQSYIDRRQRLPTPMPPSRHLHHHGQGTDQHRQRSSPSPQNPFERSITEYARPAEDPSRGGTPMSHRYDRRQDHHSGSVAGTPRSTGSGGRIHYITKNTPYAFTGGAEKVRHRENYSGGEHHRKW
ncbi:hypothetical protein IV203_015237 [Nitzschia inconspicua]|uniref:RING-type domain-containing protein n=1 Tax=Nitzschia inconspicua TaxID=303405 RepID=A0A9K3PTA5_9STRA|nr:hypothetical protein IV203_015237 [Nitzschia inconspicua]